MDQKPPMATPISARPAMNTPALGASATTVPETTISPVSPINRVLRFHPVVSGATSRLVSSAKAPDTAMPWPAWPSVIRRSAAISVSRLTGRNSEATRAKAASDKASTAPQWAGGVSGRADEEGDSAVEAMGCHCWQEH